MGVVYRLCYGRTGIATVLDITKASDNKCFCTCVYYTTAHELFSGDLSHQFIETVHTELPSTLVGIHRTFTALASLLSQKHVPPIQDNADP